MRYKIIETQSFDQTQRHVVIERASGEYTSFPASLDNPAYVAFLEQTGLTDTEVQAAELDVWVTYGS